MSRLDPAQSRAALAGEILFEVRDLAVERVSGPDALSFVQGQISQDVEPLEAGASAEALVLSPQGKIVALVRVIRTARDSFLLVGEAGLSAALHERLARFKIRVKADLEPLAWLGLFCYSSRATPPRSAARLEGLARELSGEHHLVDLCWPNLDAHALFAPAEVLVRAQQTVVGGDRGVLESLRIAAGEPRAPAELDERTIAEEAGLVERTVSFTKGCYTGQELVARLDARGGNVARRLRLVEVAGSVGARPEVGDTLVLDGAARGELTSLAPSEAGGHLALGYFHRSLTPPVAVELTGRGGTYPAEVRALPARE